MGSAAETSLPLLMEQRERLVAEIEALQNKIAGLDIAINLLSETAANQKSGAGKARVTDVLIDLLSEVGTRGLNARMAAGLASERGLPLNRQSVSSLLSRLKKDGTVVYENGFYKLQKFSRSLALMPAPDHETAA